MPTRGTAAAVSSGKKTLSDSEVLAYSKNRFVEYSLRRKVRLLSDQEQECHDRHQQEIQVWKNFMRQSTKTSGVWSTALQSATEEWPPLEDSTEPAGTEQVANGTEPLSPGPKAAPKGNLSNELARSLTFQSEALSQLQKPWRYTYSEVSHNTMYKEAAEVARVMETRLYVRRSKSAAASKATSKYLPGKHSFRSQSSTGEVGQQCGGRARPLTGRSTPGVLHRAHSSSQDKLTQSSLKNNRPKTTVGVSRTTPRQRKTAWVEGNNRNANEPHRAEGNSTSTELQGHKTEDKPGHVSETQDNVTTTVFELTQNKEPSPVVVDKESIAEREALPVLNTNTVPESMPDISRTIPETDGNCQLPKSAPDSETQTPLVKDGTPVRSESNAYLAHSTNLQLLLASNLRKPRKDNAKKVQIKFEDGLKNRPKDINLTDSGTRPESSQQEGQSKADPVTPVEDGVKDRNSASVTVPTAAASEAAASGQSETVPEVSDNTQPGSPSHPVASQRGSDVRSKVFGSNQRLDMTSTSEVPQTERRGSSSAQRTFSAVVGIRRRGSFLKIADQLEAMREGNTRRLPRVDDEMDTESPDQREGSRPPDKAAAIPAREKEIKVSEAKDNILQKVKVISTVATKLKNSSKAASQKLDKAEDSQQRPETHPADDVPPTLIKALTEIGTDKTPLDDAIPNLSSPPKQDDEQDDDDDVMNVYPSDNSSYAGSDYTLFNGYKIRNYVRPQFRYRSDPFIVSRRERSLFRLSIDNPVYLSGTRGDLKSEMLFPKTCRQKVLQELVQRNNQPVRMPEGGAVPPELRARIDKFLKTIEPFCPKPQVVLE